MSSQYDNNLSVHLLSHVISFTIIYMYIYNNRLNIFAFLRRKLFSSVHVLLRSSCARFSQLVISLKIMSLVKVNKKSWTRAGYHVDVFLWCIRNLHYRFGFKWSLFSPAPTLSDRSPKFYDTFRPNFSLKHDVCFYFEPHRCLYDYSSFEC